MLISAYFVLVYALNNSPDASDYAPNNSSLESSVANPSVTPTLTPYPPGYLGSQDAYIEYHGSGYRGLELDESSLKERVALSDLIAVGRLISARAVTIKNQTRNHPIIYRGVIAVKFKVSGYIYGQGPNEIEAYINHYTGPPNYSTEEAAMQAANLLLDARDKRWDDRDALLFLIRRDGDTPMSWLDDLGLEEVYSFAYPDDIGFPDLRRVEVSGTSNKVWLPEARPSSESSTAWDDGDRYFIADAQHPLETDATDSVRDDSASAQRNPVASLSEVKRLIKEVDQQTNTNMVLFMEWLEEARADPEAFNLDPEWHLAQFPDDYEPEFREYKQRLGRALYEERRDKAVAERDAQRAEAAHSSSATTPKPKKSVTDELMSGLPEGSVVGQVGWFSAAEYGDHVILGRDAKLFKVDRDDSDNDPSNGYLVRDVTIRPLPRGVYNLKYLSYPCTRNVNQNGIDRLVCKRPSIQKAVNWNVIVIAHQFALHEAFFDPETMASPQGAVGEEIGEDVAIPNDSTVELTQLFYESKSVKLVMDPYHAMSDYRIDIIKLDGTIGWSFRFDQSAKSQAGSMTAHEWQYCGTPWQAGDQLMIRIIEKNAATVAALSAEAQNAPSCPASTPTPTHTPIPPLPTDTPTPTPVVATATPTPIPVVPPTATPTHTPTPVPMPPPTSTPTPTPVPVDGPKLSISDASANAGNDLVFIVTLDDDAHSGVFVNFDAHEGTAKSGTDYRAPSGTLIFDPFETEKTIKVGTIVNQSPEGTETMRMVLSQPIGATIEDEEGIGTITD